MEERILGKLRIDKDSRKEHSRHIVYEAQFGDMRYVLKKARSRVASDIIEVAGMIRDKMFYGLRTVEHYEDRFRGEAQRYLRMNGNFAPKLYDYDVIKRNDRPKGKDEHLMALECITGKKLGELERHQREQTIDEAVIGMAQMHEKGILFDTHARHVMQSDRGAIWLDLSGRYQVDLPFKTEAENLLKFVYTTYTVTKDADTAFHAATSVRSNYPNSDVLKTVSEMVSPGLPLWRLFLYAGIPLTAKGAELNEEIQEVLRV